MALLYRSGTAVTRLYYGTDTHAQSLFVGATLALALLLTQGQRRRIGRTGRRSLTLLGWLGLGALAGLMFTPSAKSMFSFGILVLVLLFRPQGILGKRTA